MTFKVSQLRLCKDLSSEFKRKKKHLQQNYLLYYTKNCLWILDVPVSKIEEL